MLFVESLLGHKKTDCLTYSGQDLSSAGLSLRIGGPFFSRPFPSYWRTFLQPAFPFLLEDLSSAGLSPSYWRTFLQPALPFLLEDFSSAGFTLLIGRLFFSRLYPSYWKTFLQPAFPFLLEDLWLNSEKD
jgi:hypothetical protein